MSKYKKMPGETYRIVSISSSSITVECTYLCPYCMTKTTASFDAPIDSASLVESGGWFERLTCSNCGKISDVRYFGSNKI